MTLSNTSCALCAIELPKHPIIEGDHAYCCAGCHAVFNILSSKNQLVNFEQHPLFQQALRSGLISNPALLEQIRRNRPDVPENELEKLHLEIQEMWCPACSEVIKLILLQQKGILNCVVDYSTDLAAIEWTPRYISKEKIFEIISSIGYRPQSFDSVDRKAVSSDLYMRFIVAAFCSINVMMFAYPLYAIYFNYDEQGYGGLFAWMSLIASLPVLGYSAVPIFRRFWVSLQVGLFGMESLVVMGVATAFGLSLYDLLTGGTKVYFDSMTVIIVFVLLGKIIEAKAKFSAKDSLFRLVRALPRRGRKQMADGSAQFVPIKEIELNDMLVAFSGEKIVLDGLLTKGEGTFDESLITGEAIPVVKQIGDPVFGGSILQNGSVTFSVKAKIEDSTLHKILGMIQLDIGHKTAYVRAADRIVCWFVPIVLSIALMTILYCLVFDVHDEGRSTLETAFVRAISVLLISCPCAIGIAAPLAESHLMSGLAALGAIVRNRGCLALLGQETIFVFDKTGTITEGCFTVLNGLENLTEHHKAILKGIASQSNHLMARAIAQAIDAPHGELDEVKEYIGKGLMAKLNDECYLLGSAAFLSQHQISLPPTSIDQAYHSIVSPIYFAVNGVCLATIVLGDRIREGSKELIQALAPVKTVLLSGDTQSAVESVAHFCGFSEWKYGHSPSEKQAYIESLRHQGHLVCMIGDGINDAPSLTSAHIGISVVTATDISIQVSDLLLTTDRLQVLSKIRALAKRGQKILQQNLFWAFFYNVVGIGLAATGILSPIFAAFAMVASSLMVLFNARRI